MKNRPDRPPTSNLQLPTSKPFWATGNPNKNSKTLYEIFTKKNLFFSGGVEKCVLIKLWALLLIFITIFNFNICQVNSVFIMNQISWSQGTVIHFQQSIANWKLVSCHRCSFLTSNFQPPIGSWHWKLEIDFREPIFLFHIQSPIGGWKLTSW